MFPGNYARNFWDFLSSLKFHKFYNCKCTTNFLIKYWNFSCVLCAENSDCKNSNRILMKTHVKNTWKPSNKDSFKILIVLKLFKDPQTFSSGSGIYSGPQTPASPHSRDYPQPGSTTPQSIFANILLRSWRMGEKMGKKSIFHWDFCM